MPSALRQEGRPAGARVASVDLLVDDAPDGLDEKAQVFDDGVHVHHGWDTNSPMFYRAADLGDLDAEFGEMVGQAWFGEHEKCLDTFPLGEGDDGQVKADGDVREAGLVLGPEVVIAEGEGGLGFPFATPVMVAHGQS